MARAGDADNAQRSELPLYRTSGKPWEVCRVLEMACQNAELSLQEITILKRG